MAEIFLQLEQSADNFLLEDSTGLLLLESTITGPVIPPTLIVRMSGVMQLRKSS